MVLWCIFVSGKLEFINSQIFAVRMLLINLLSLLNQIFSCKNVSFIEFHFILLLARIQFMKILLPQIFNYC